MWLEMLPKSSNSIKKVLWKKVKLCDVNRTQASIARLLTALRRSLRKNDIAYLIQKIDKKLDYNRPLSYKILRRFPDWLNIEQNAVDISLARLQLDYSIRKTK